MLLAHSSIYTFNHHTSRETVRFVLEVRFLAVESNNASSSIPAHCRNFHGKAPFTNESVASWANACRELRTTGTMQVVEGQRERSPVQPFFRWRETVRGTERTLNLT